jgi:hypothetical protein
MTFEELGNKLFCDLKNDAEKANFFLSGRGYETGVVAKAIQNDIAMTYHRCAVATAELRRLHALNGELLEALKLAVRQNEHDIIRMAREAGSIDSEDVIETVYVAFAAAERERLKWDGIHSCHSECDRPACVNLRKAVEAEREACAKVCDGLVLDYPGRADLTANQCAVAIRARGEK